MSQREVRRYIQHQSKKNGHRLSMQEIKEKAEKKFKIKIEIKDKNTNKHAKDSLQHTA